ncbi:TPA: NTPase, partial [Kluyvera cryocrescens]|nr:NTPase [Kluyvera cryocrescens]
MNTSFNIRDEYQRKKIAENLKTLLDASIDISPVVIDGAWGTGKTEFSLKLKNYLSSEITDSFIIYLDAFEEDHCDDPLLSITAAIAKNLPKKKKESFVKAAIPAVKFGAKTALKAGVAWVVRENATTIINDFESEIKDATNSLIDNTIEKLLDEHIHAEENI